MTQPGDRPQLVMSPSGRPLLLDVVHEPAKRLRPTAAARLEARLRRLLQAGEVAEGVVFEGTEGRNCALLGTLTGEPSSLDASSRWRTEIVDHRDGSAYSVVNREDGLFHFINVFHIAPGRREQMIEYFAHTIPAVRVQPGYVSTNLVVNDSGTRAANVGQYERREDFVAIFRQPAVLRAFAAGTTYKVMPTVLGVLPRLPRLRLYGTPRTLLAANP